ncbi:unnamed protein product [Toxocara canis]|uniref:Helitron helicase n=1 Tax=Toxocara canis TaxID=6265 RepID=A0A183U8M7_TOXCA|nr:unnamed protein product [Toxocara canis]
MDNCCPNCAALHFPKEPFVCCSGGRVSVPSISQPQLFKDLFRCLHRHSVSFIKNIRNINSLFAMASLTASEEHLAGGMQVYKIAGEVYVNVSALYERSPIPAFDVDEANELRQRTAPGAQVHRDLLVDIDECLRGNNEYCKMYMRFHEVFQSAL